MPTTHAEQLATATVVYPLVFVLVGLAIWAYFTPPPRRTIAPEAGRLTFFAGIIVLALLLARFALQV